MAVDAKAAILRGRRSATGSAARAHGEREVGDVGGRRRIDFARRSADGHRRPRPGSG